MTRARLQPLEDLKVIDFRRSMWGHALHGHTFTAEPAPTCIQRITDRLTKTRRYSVMVHVTPAPKVGQVILYRAGDGHDRTATITAVDACMDPCDMFTLHLVVRDTNAAILLDGR